MSITSQKQAERGSQKWLQVLVNDKPELFSSKVRDAAKLQTAIDIEWRSPLKSKNYAEYGDADFLTLLDVVPPLTSLEEFWPARGPVWDALGKTNSGDLLLVEAKAHIPEVVTPGTGATADNSIIKINSSLDKTKQFIAPSSDVDWSKHFYQYTNRLAHLFWLRELNHLSAYMIFVSFYSDEDMKGPKTRDEWEGAIKLMKTFLGIHQRTNPLAPYSVNLFVDVRDLQ